MKEVFVFKFVLCFLIAFGVGCGGCDVEKPKPKEVVKVEPKKVEPPKEDPLKEAKADADVVAGEAGISILDAAQAIAGEIEAANTPKPKVGKTRPPREKAEPETGKLAKAELRRVFNVHAGAMRKCYERQLKKNPSLSGKVSLEVLIRSNGSVRSARANGVSLQNGLVNNCMERQARTMKFPTPKGGAVRVTMPYAFKPDS